jgi:predicted nucleic acid-binding protein
LVAAFATRGLCADLFELLTLEHELFIGDVVLKELRKVLRSQLRVPIPTCDEIQTLLCSYAMVPKPRKRLGLKLREELDWMLASAVAAKVDVVTTGDKTLLAAKGLPLKCVSPRGLWDLVRR